MLRNKNVIYAIFLILIILIVVKTCNTSGCKSVETNYPDTSIVIKYDTVYVAGQQVNIPIYIPVVTYVDSPSKPIAPPKENHEELVIQYRELASKFYSHYIYEDSISLKDDRYPGKSLGIVRIKDNISENQIVKRKVDYRLNFPQVTNTVTTTITNTVVTPSKRQIYAGGGFTGNQKDRIIGANLGLIYKSKDDHIINITGGGQSIGGKLQPIFGLSAYWKIKL